MARQYSSLRLRKTLTRIRKSNDTAGANYGDGDGNDCTARLSQRHQKTRLKMPQGKKSGKILCSLEPENNNGMGQRPMKKERWSEKKDIFVTQNYQTTKDAVRSALPELRHQEPNKSTSRSKERTISSSAQQKKYCNYNKDDKKKTEEHRQHGSKQEVNPKAIITSKTNNYFARGERSGKSTFFSVTTTDSMNTSVLKSTRRNSSTENHNTSTSSQSARRRIFRGRKEKTPKELVDSHTKAKLDSDVSECIPLDSERNTPIHSTIRSPGVISVPVAEEGGYNKNFKLFHSCLRIYRRQRLKTLPPNQGKEVLPDGQSPQKKLEIVQTIPKKGMEDKMEESTSLPPAQPPAIAWVCPPSDNETTPAYAVVGGIKVTRIDMTAAVFVIDLVEPQICDLILRLTDEHMKLAESEEAGHSFWRKLYTYTTMDIPCREVGYLADITDKIVENVVRIIRLIFGSPSSSAALLPRTWKEPHLLRYQKLPGLPDHTGTELHWDGSHITWQLMLSDETEYKGGGTYFSCLDQTIKLKKGQVLIHPGTLYHKGVDISSGVRTLIVCFMDWLDPKIDEKDEETWKNLIEAWEERV